MDGRQKKGRVWLFILAGLVAFLGASLLLLHQLAHKGQEEARMDVRASDTPTDLGAFLDSPSLDSSIGNIAFFNNIYLEQGPTKRVFFARDRSGRRVAVLWDAVAMQLPQEGTVADLLGIIRPLPPLRTITREWKLSKSEAEQLRDDSVYVEADVVKPLKPTQRNDRTLRSEVDPARSAGPQPSGR